MTTIQMRELDAGEINLRNERQATVLDWCKATFAAPNGDLDEATPDTRCLRFVEEAIELAQAHGLDKALVLKQLEEVFSRPRGEPVQEIGGVMVTLNAYCESTGVSLAVCEDLEIIRCNARPIEHFQARQKEKRERGL